MGSMASQVTSLAIVYSAVCSGADQRKHQSSALLAICAGNSLVPVNSLFPFDDVIMNFVITGCINTLRLGQSGRSFTDDIFKRFFLNENYFISIQISLKYVLQPMSNYQYASIGSDNGLAPNMRQVNIWSSVGIFYWCICASLGLIELKTLRPVKSLGPNDAIYLHWKWLRLVQLMAWQTLVNFESKAITWTKFLFEEKSF